MLKSIISVDPRNLDQLNFPGKLTKYDMNIIKEITDILTTFQVATEQCEGGNVVSTNMCIPYIHGLRAKQ